MMKQTVWTEINNTFWMLFKIFALLILSFELYRTLFFIYFHDKVSLTDSIFTELIKTYWYGLSIDIATASFAMAIPWVLITFYSLVRLELFKSLLKLYVMVILFIISASYITELGVYNEWELKPNYEVFSYLSHPDEILNSNPWFYTFLLTVIAVISAFVFYKLIQKIFENSMVKTAKNYWVTLIFFLLVPGLVILGARGGTSSAVISQADAYFSKQQLYNDAAINTVYNLLKTTLNGQAVLGGENPYRVTLESAKKFEVLEPLVQTPLECNTTSIFTTSRPNVVVIILESWAGDFIDDDPKYRAVVPNFMKLSKEGILFSKTYGSGALSHEGIPSVLSAWPDLFNVNITEFSKQHSQLPSITESLVDNGYKETMFIYGGQLRYGNLKSYFYKNKFDILEESKDITSITDKDAFGRLGIHDSYMFPYLVKKINKLQQPFFASMFTLSSHSPYDQPMEDVITWADGDNDFLNSVYYTDRSIAEFITLAKKEPWYKNTLFVFVSDHSHHTPRAWSRNNPRWHHIPMLFYGEVIKKEYRGLEMDKIVSQHDLAATLLSQLQINHDKFSFSRDLFCSEYQPSAYFSVTDGYGIITPDGYVAYDIVNKRVKGEDGNNSKTLMLQGQLYLEYLFQTFLDY